jgi:hypothetical protein
VERNAWKNKEPIGDQGKYIYGLVARLQNSR